MKKNGMINREIAAVLARMGHTDQLTIADCGLPVPEGVPCIDLSYTLGKPGFTEILFEVLKDFEVEKMIIAEEIKVKNPDIYEEMKRSGKRMEEVSHEALKELTKQSKAIIRTGEATPYANCILQSGVIF
ncbi:D-ribose pyranase [Sporosarcina sp.]|uniref:D-ribose pyranase n=1 Tax=Sporosarcina sp. TaxID=49982 RepID=UPI002615B9C7|nr:D-ribose pyranase [Sporosarcina sp.]